MKVKLNTQRVAEFRERQAALGTRTMSCMIDREAHEAIETIMYKRMTTKRDAIETAVKKYAAELTRKR